MTKLDRVNSVDSADIVIVGNGIAGLTAAVDARRLAPGKRIIMITEQSHPTINTPALKQFAIGKLNREQLLAYPAGTERAQLIHVINARVEEINAQGKYVQLRGGRGFGYGDLLIATGSAPTGLPANLPGRDFDGVLSLHRLNDYLDLRRRLSEVEEVVVIGGGAHAIETVMGMLYLGIRVHWLIRSATFLPRMLDQPASGMVLEAIQRAGAMVYTETEAVGIVGRVGGVAGVVTNQQQLLPCQLVLACTGTAPVTSLARHCDVPMKYKQGILVDDQLRTNVPHIYAAGDVAAILDPQTGIYTPRAQWYAAVLQGRMAAASMTGAPREEGFGVPWHATRLGDLLMLTVGNVLQWQDTITTLTDSGRGSYRRMCVIDDRLVGYLSLGPAQPDSLAIKRIIDEGLSIRDIKKALLKGTFDARKYFSRQRTNAAQRMVTTGKLPRPADLMPFRLPDTQCRTQSVGSRNMDPMPRALTTRKLPDMDGQSAAVSENIVTHDQTALQAQLQFAREGDPGGRPLPDTGPLTASSAITRNTSEDLQLFADPFVAAPINLEHFQQQNVREETRSKSNAIPKKPHFVESTIVMQPAPAPVAQRPSGSLWSYVGTKGGYGADVGASRLSSTPASKAREAEHDVPSAGARGNTGSQRALQGQFKAPLLSKSKKRQPGRPGESGGRYPSSSLWSYSDKFPTVKKGR